MNTVFPPMRHCASAALIAFAGAGTHAGAQQEAQTDVQAEAHSDAKDSARDEAQDAAVQPQAAAPQAAQSAGVQAPDKPAPVKINARKNPGDLSYKSFFGIQSLLQSFQPPEPRVIDFTYRLSFNDIKGAARDEFNPGAWAVAIVGDSFDQVVPVGRGGYFVLPDLPQATKESATVMFNAQTRWRTLEVSFKLRVSAQQTLAYVDFAKALDEFRFVQDQIPWYRLGLRAIRNAKLDGLRACFRSGDGRIEIDGAPAPARADGNCQVLKFDAAKAGARTATITFIGALDYVTLDENDR